MADNPYTPPSTTPQPGGAPQYQVPNQDVEHLKLLAIFHYIFGGLSLFGACFGLIYVVIGIVMASNPDGSMSEEEARIAGGVMGGIGGFVVVVCIVLGGLIAYSGRCIQTRTKRVFSMVIAGILCTSPPLGTALGIFTFIVLMRDSVKPLYDGQSGA